MRFCGTTNEDYFLKGDTNRRFWVIATDESLRRYNNDDLGNNRDQLWAEAVQRYKDGEKLYLPKDLEGEARQRQKDYSDDNDDPLQGALATFVDTLLPAAGLS